ncbi:hypothetical protein QG516_20890 [Pedobacter gandavensis]|uniref:hypothetical protein n=1 Tax=Pedobacter gandavensis TaxID=2679963 RepID=UPI002478D443|nr:hypothetical protein [Pedobacter gandavensis]WGQ08973.1 hypothetical protein QG516_20890 [Pedobacter gandavensis]
MNEIKTLADQLREQIRSGESESILPEKKDDLVETIVLAKPKRPLKAVINDAQAAVFFAGLEAFRLNGTEKSLIRLDSKTMNLLKRIKLAKGIDMNRFIVYSLHQYLDQHPWIAAHIQETLKNSEL